MKKLMIIALAFSSVTIYGQDTAKIRREIQTKDDIQMIVEAEIMNDEVNINLKSKDFVKVHERNDTTSIMFKNKELRIIEDGDNSTIKFIDTEKDSCKKKRFRGHWVGMQLGLNNYIDNDFSISRTPENEFMDLHTGKSWSININFAQYSAPIIRDRFGLVTGLGLEYNNYAFNDNNTIVEEHNPDYIVSEIYPFTIEKSKLKVVYLTAPLMAELQLGKGNRNKRFHISAGVIAGIKLGSKTKVVYFEDGVRQKDKKRNDYYLSPFRYGLTTNFGFSPFSFYATYYASTLFIKNKGPELYPFSIGFSLTI